MRILLIGLVLFTGMACTPAYEKSAKEALQGLNEEDVLFGEGLAQFLKANEGQYLLVDLRNAADFKASHTEGAIDIPIPQLMTEDHQSLLKSKEYILLSGDSYTQTAGAQVLLKRLGFDQVKLISLQDSIRPEAARYDYGAVFAKVQEEHAAAIEAGKPKPIVSAPPKRITPPKKKVVEEEEGC